VPKVLKEILERKVRKEIRAMMATPHTFKAAIGL
jgi:hypothetical protein